MFLGWRYLDNFQAVPVKWVWLSMTPFSLEAGKFMSEEP